MQWTPVTGVVPADLTPREVARRFRALADSGANLRPAGDAREAPARLLEPPFLPRHVVALFDATYYLTDFFHIEDLNFFVGYVAHEAAHEAADAGAVVVYPRIFYKDSSLIWRVASHIIDCPQEQWIGKGDVRVEHVGGRRWIVSDESSTNLPYEIQTAFDTVSRRRPSTRNARALRLVLRNAPPGRMHPYADFSRPRRRAAQRYPINGGRRVARLQRRGDPASLRFAEGFEPDFDAGPLDVGTSRSNLYGGDIRKYRFRSKNGHVQYQLVCSPTHVWINPPQSFMPEITSYGVRALHVQADDDIFIPAFEYHFLDASVDPPELYSQIPDGWAGAQSTVDPHRADASRWIDALPVIVEFRRWLDRARATSRGTRTPHCE